MCILSGARSIQAKNSPVLALHPESRCLHAECEPRAKPHGPAEVPRAPEGKPLSTISLAGMLPTASDLDMSCHTHGIYGAAY